MSQLFSTELLPASDRIDAWQWNAQRICGDCRIQLPRASFHGSIEIRQISALKFTRFSSSPLSFWKWPSDSAADGHPSCIVITQLLGVRCYEQNGLEVLLKPGDSMIVDTSRPWSSNCTTDCVRLYFRMPRWMMESRLGTREIPIARRIPGATRFGAELSSLSQSLYEQATRMDEEETAAALEMYFQTLAACVRRGETAKPRNPELLMQIVQFIDGHLAEPELTPVSVAFAMGISLRHLHRVFSASGNTFSDYVRTRRLEQCRQDLLNPRFRDRNITDIAFCWGFSDAAHFSHSFSKQFGVSPRSFREKSMRLAGRCTLQSLPQTPYSGLN